MQKAFEDYAAIVRPAECPEEKRKEIREGMQLFIDKFDSLWYWQRATPEWGGTNYFVLV